MKLYPILEVSRMLTCSTAHISEQDADALRERVSGLVVHDWGEYGWIIWTDKDAIKENAVPELSADFLRLLAFARKHDCEWLRLDCDGGLIDGLPTWEW